MQTTVLSSASKLHQFAEDSQLTQELGGTLPYDHNKWIDTRLEIDELSDEAATLNDKFDELEQQLDTHRLGSNIIETGDLLQEHEARRDLLDNVAQPLIKRGEHLINSIKANEPPIPPSLNFPGSSSAMPSQERQQMEGIVNVLMHRYNQLLDMWEKRWKELMQCMDLREFEAGYKKVIDWVLGPGERYLSTSKDIGDSVITCEILRKEHEEFEHNARDVINHFARVRELAKKMLQENHYASNDLKTQKDFLDKGCRTFAMRMNRRRDIILTSLKFHKSAGDCSLHLDDLFELLCTDSVLLYDYETAESMLRTLEEKAEAVAASSEETLRDALALQELMTSSVVDMRGENVTPDYSRGVAHVRMTLDELRERKLRTDELCDVRRIKLQQLLQLRQSERDAEQATEWISQLRDATEHNLGDVGRNADEADALQKEHEKLEATARSTYDYGRQFLQASLVLRRTCRYELSPNYEMEEKLNKVWSEFSSAMAERGARLSVALMFHRSAQKLIQKMEDLRSTYISDDLPDNTTAAIVGEEISRHSDTKQAIDKEYAETVAMARALIDRMQLSPLYDEDGAPSRPPHLLEEILQNLEDRKADWERVWKERDERLHHWLRLGDYQQQMSELLEWVKETISETQKNLYDIGENLTEAQGFSSNLQDLELNLKDREKEVTEILRVIKSLIVTDKDRVKPHGSMADSLEEAWNDLNEQLEGRRILLDTSVAFHQSVEQFSTKIDTSQDEISRVLLAEDITSSSSLLHQHQELRKSVLELSMQTLSNGQVLLDKLREASTHADINKQHASKAACYSVERILEALQQRRQQLDDLWRERKKLLEQCIKRSKIDEEMRKIMKWLNEEAEDYLSYKEYGDSMGSTQVLLDEHVKFEEALKDREEAAHKLARETEKLVNGGFTDMEDTQATATQLQTNMQLLRTTCGGTKETTD
ncbi:SEC14 domain and spectrin repeat-containing protein 1-B-like isoform X2 [Acropora millepora]|uniref:SEC14 domain and spectrin repeat-containing protein 1-B-like isoform X2 n=1 Tax=Acropora millepora TaxID=45264 RepID=UPI001CF268EA|nr:SEC14 domain and spectrin repeat-containing protein 1-B-like isoform X2 [Acropora millepora]